MRILIVKSSDWGFYGLEEGLAKIPSEDVWVRVSLFEGANYPLHPPLPSRIDAVQGFVGLGEYDLIILANIDPQSLTVKEQTNLLAYVEKGGGLMLIGGPHSYGNVKGTYQLLDVMLPAHICRESTLDVDAEPSTVMDHPITCGIPQDLGKVTKIHPVKPKVGASVLMEARARPLLVAWEYGKGRAAMLNTYPDVYYTTESSFFTSNFYDDLMRQAAMWLSHRHSSVIIKDFNPTGKQLYVGEEDSVRITLFAERLIDRSIERVNAKFKVSKDDKIIYEDARSVEPSLVPEGGERSIIFIFKTDEGYENDGTYDLKVEILNEAGDLLNLRDWKVTVLNKKSLDISIDSRKAVVAPSSTLEFAIGLKPYGSVPEYLKADVWISDFNGETVETFPRKAIGEDKLRFEYIVPNLESGRYKIVSKLSVEKTGEVLDEAEKEFLVVDPLSMEDVFPIFSIVGMPWGGCDEDMVKERIDDIIKHGYNTLDIVGLGDYDWEREYNWDKMLNFAEAYAQEKGMFIAYEGHLVPFSRNKPLPICANSPDFFNAERSYLVPQLRTLMKIPRLFNVKIVDEPLVTPDSVCYCEHCREAYSKQYEEEMPVFKNIRDYGLETRLNLFKFISDYWVKVFNEIYRIRNSLPTKFDLRHTFCQLSFGSFCPEHYFRDALAWAPYCELIDFDIYPYLYPIFRCSEQLRFHQVHYQIAGHRDLCRHLNKKLGFWVETVDRNYPMYVVPTKASGEIAHTAIAQGARFITTFWNEAFGERNHPRRERWDQFGADLVKISKSSPLLTRVERPRASIALLFPFLNWLLSHKHEPHPTRKSYKTIEDRPFNKAFPRENSPWNGYELFFRAFGELDLLHENLIDELDQYKALVLLGMSEELGPLEYLPDRVAEKIVEWVNQGGILIFDAVPKFNEKGEEKRSLQKIVGSKEINVCGDLRAFEGSTGKGKTLYFNFDLDDTYSTSIETNDNTLRKALKEMIRDFLFQEGLRPHAFPWNSEFEAGLLEGRNCFVLVVIDHNAKPDTSKISLYNPRFTPVYAYDLATMEEQEFEIVDGNVQLDLVMDEREGKILAFYPERPETNRVEIERALLKQGENLVYKVVMENLERRSVKGHHVVKIEVEDPHGRVQPRYGGIHTTTDGVYKRDISMAENATRGEWTITAYDRYTRHKSKAVFSVT